MRNADDKNVYFDKSCGKFKVQVGIDYRNVTLGYFGTKAEAKAYRDQWLSRNDLRSQGPHQPSEAERAKYYTSLQVAEFFECSIASICAAARTGALPSVKYRLNTSRRYFPRAEIDAIVEDFKDSMTKHEAAQELGRSVHSVAKYIQSGRLRRVSFPGNVCRIPCADVERLRLSDDPPWQGAEHQEVDQRASHDCQ